MSIILVSVLAGRLSADITITKISAGDWTNKTPEELLRRAAGNLGVTDSREFDCAKGDQVERFPSGVTNSEPALVLSNESRGEIKLVNHLGTQQFYVLKSSRLGTLYWLFRTILPQEIHYIKVLDSKVIVMHPIPFKPNNPYQRVF
ncbi:hypothetical protein PCANC_03844 [Puccinia coronata f. sp. avenae]|uniref:Uncharacterized protein n=1 Tax=Puccinia coronata f. sp. avenae TaxID=200324 RepID=A0A2N5T7F6_9BASI|nr:hypothetical protein PCANC_03844 [Puccinia coronata f. sp. avenae]